MSDNEIKKDKVVTRYDRKMQRRQEEKEKEARRKKISQIIGAIVAVALVVLIASFPIRAYQAANGTFITMNGEKITRVEFDYNYHNVVNDYVNQYGSYLSYFGLDVNSDFSTQMHSEDLSWKDYFEQVTVDNMKKTKGLKLEADAAGFTFDATQEIADFKKAVKDAAKENNTSVKKYIKSLYGQYASVNAIADYVEESARVNAYYEQLSDSMEATDEEVQNYYNENTDSYDSVDYYVGEYVAEITAEEPTEEQITAAMEIAKEQADTEVAVLESRGEKQVNQRRSSVPSAIRDWLFDSARKANDTSVIEDTDNNTYYAVKFVDRYLDETPTADIRLITVNTDETTGQAVVDEWKEGEATEDSFAALYDTYNSDTGYQVDGGLMEGITTDNVPSEVADWALGSGRASGDVDFVETESGTCYVMYYVGLNDPDWKLDVKSTLLSQAQTEYMNQIAEYVTVEDPKGNLNYLKVQQAAENVSDGDASTGDASTGDASEGDVSADVQAQ